MKKVEWILSKTEGGFAGLLLRGFFLIPVSFYVVEKLSRGRRRRPAGAETPGPEPAAGD